MPCGRRNRTGRTPAPRSTWKFWCAAAASGCNRSGRRARPCRYNRSSRCKGCRRSALPCQRPPAHCGGWAPPPSADTGGKGRCNQSVRLRRCRAGSGWAAPGTGSPAEERHRSSGSALRCAGCARRSWGRCAEHRLCTGTSIHSPRHGRGCGCSGQAFRSTRGDRVRRSPGRPRYHRSAPAVCRSLRRDSHNISA